MSQSVVNITETKTIVKSVEKKVLRAEWSKEEWVEQHYETWKAQKKKNRHSDYSERQERF